MSNASLFLVATTAIIVAQAVQLAQLPSQYTSAGHFASSCSRGQGKGLELNNAVLYNRKVYCANGEATTGVAIARLTTPTHDGNGAEFVPKIPIVPANTVAIEANEEEEVMEALPERCSYYLPEHAMFIGAIYWGQIGHFLYNTVASLFSVLGLVETHAAGEDVYTRKKAELKESLQLFIYPDIELNDARWQQLWVPMPLEGSPPAEILRTFTTHPAMFLRPLLEHSSTQAFCFRKLTLGLHGSKLDHYMDDVPAEDWVLFRNELAAGFGAQAVPRCSRSMTNVVLVQRKHRKILNAYELVDGLREVLNMSKTGPGRVQMVYFEDLSFAQQIQLMAQADVLIGVDGTGLFNANFMAAGSYLIRIKPYALDIILPGKSENFRRIWRALGIHELTWSPSHMNQTVSPLGARRLQAFIDNALDPASLPKSQLPLAFDAVMSQDTLVDVRELQQLLLQALIKMGERGCDAREARD